MMQIMPLIIWASSLKNIDEFSRAIVADVELFHPDKLVQ